MFEAIASNFDEQLDDARSPAAVAVELAYGKARDVASQYPNSYVIGSDTIVTIDGTQLAKPADIDDARRMLSLLAGRIHEVTTGVVLVTPDVSYEAYDTTHVHFKPYDSELVEAYLATGDSLDKAGAYGIQSGAGVLIEYIDGAYDTVIGFPTRVVSELLSKVGVDARPLQLACPVEQRN